MNLLIVNCNTTVAMTDAIVECARAVAATDTSIVGLTPSWGPASAEGFYESFVTAAAVFETVLTHDGQFDAVVMAGYGEHGREGLRQLIEQPVVDITEASAQLAGLLAHRYGVVTTLSTAVPGIVESLHSAGLDRRCVGVRATAIPVRAIHELGDEALDELEAAAHLLLTEGAEAIVLGCAGFSGLDQRLEDRLGIPVLDSVASAVVLAEDLVRLGKHTSKIGAFRAPNRAKQWSGWPRAKAGA